MTLESIGAVETVKGVTHGDSGLWICQDLKAVGLIGWIFAKGLPWDVRKRCFGAGVIAQWEEHWPCTQPTWESGFTPQYPKWSDLCVQRQE